MYIGKEIFEKKLTNNYFAISLRWRGAAHSYDMTSISEVTH